MVLFILFILQGCASRKSPAQGESIHRIHFEGNGRSLNGTSDYNLRTAMVQGHNPPLTGLLRPQNRRVYLNRQELMTDGWRIETWYAHRGYFDASFEGWHVNEIRGPVRFGPWNAPRKVEIIGHVNEGPASTVRSIHWDGLDTTGDAPLRGLLIRKIPLREGERFDLDYIEDSRDLVLGALHERSHALARVDITVEAFPAEQAVDIRVAAIPGPHCRFGAVQLVGSYRAPEHKIQDAISIREGERYTASALGDTQKALFALGIFSVVNIIPELEDAESGLVPVRIELSETRPRELRLGGGMGWESGKKEVRASADLSHTNLFKRLIRLELQNEAGFASLSEFDDVDLEGADGIGEIAEESIGVLSRTSGPVVDLSASVIVPDVPLRYLDLEQTIGYEIGVEPGYRFSSIEVSPGIRLDVDAWMRQREQILDSQVSLGLHYALEQFNYLEFNLDQAAALDSPLGLDFTELYLLSSVNQSLEIDSRNDLLFTREGTYGIYTLTEAGGPFGGRFSFVRATFDQRGFIPLIRLRDRIERRIMGGANSAPGDLRKVRSERARWFGDTWLRPSSLAGRIGGGFILPYGDDERAAVPYAERINLGGSTNVRGWTLDHLGPYVYHPDTGIQGEGSPGVEQLNEDIVPLGGLIALHTSGELRIYGVNDLGLVLFTDMGNVWNAWSELKDFSLLPSVGVGLRYVTPIGPLRVDIARRLDQEPMYSLENRWALHISFSEAY